MNTIEDRIFEIAYNGGQLDDYLCGVGPYDLQSARIGAIINTDAIMQKIYSYYEAKKDDNLPRSFAEALLKLANTKTCYAVYVAMDITEYHLRAAEEGRATFNIDCGPIVDALQSNIKANKSVYSQPAEFRGFTFSDGISKFIFHFDEKIKQYGYSILS